MKTEHIITILFLIGFAYIYTTMLVGSDEQTLFKIVTGMI